MVFHRISPQPFHPAVGLGGPTPAHVTPPGSAGRDGRPWLGPRNSEIVSGGVLLGKTGDFTMNFHEFHGDLTKHDDFIVISSDSMGYEGDIPSGND